jgi:hypothetical protein
MTVFKKNVQNYQSRNELTNFCLSTKWSNQGYLVGNPVTGESIDLESRVPYAHGHGMISDQLYEVMQSYFRSRDFTNKTSIIM